MVTKRKRAKAGDVFELKIGDRFAYLHFVAKHPMYGDAVMVNPQLWEQPMAISRSYFSDGYLVFYPVSAAAAQGLVELITHIPPPRLPERFRRAGARSGRHVQTWIIEDGLEEVVKASLSDEDLRLPIAAIWNHTLLVQRIQERWNPLQEGVGHE